ncbi:MAG: hypothetical protein LRZ98_02165, partial [Candidatus Pacebacteria bacterium]|nr:hypothetical protein [Candidatus Paceibacterota bacterium]
MNLKIIIIIIVLTGIIVGGGFAIKHFILDEEKNVIQPKEEVIIKELTEKEKHRKIIKKMEEASKDRPVMSEE